jgi:molybdenum cofactor guanylyltransferase
VGWLAEGGYPAAGYAAVVLAGGAGRRLGGPGKPVLAVGGRPLLHRVLAAVADARPRVVVGPPDLPLPEGVVRVREEPPGGGPVVAAAAGLAQVDTAHVALLAADLPLLTAAAVAALRRAASGVDTDGAVYVDDNGIRQWLCGMWRTGELAAVVADAPAGSALRRVLAPLRVVELRAPARVPPPWYDCDTETDLRRAEEWADEHAG